MKFNLVFPLSFAPWNWEDSITKGIGASETSVVEMSWRLARRGHDVTVYTNLPEGSPNEFRGVKWLPISTKWQGEADLVDWNEPGIWVLYRCPYEIDRFLAKKKRDDQIIWVLAQDWDYADQWLPARIARMDRLIPLCHPHRNYLEKRHPILKGKCWVTQNGIKSDEIEKIEAEGVPERNYRRLMFSSSPDRGLKAGLKIFKRAKEYIPDLEFYVTYGFANIDILIKNGAKHFQKDKDECMRLIDETGAVMMGRIGQEQLYREHFKTAMWVYCTNFWETSHVSGAEGMAMGSIPCFTPIWAQGSNTHWGSAIFGQPHDPMTITRFAAEVVSWASNPKKQDEIRPAMMKDLRESRDWEQFVWKRPSESWEHAAAEDIEKKKPKSSWTTFDACKDPGDFDSEEDSRRRWLKLKPGDVFLDIGSNKGSWSSPALEMGATVYAFDNAPGMYDALSKHAREQGWHRRLFGGDCTIGSIGDPNGCATLDWMFVRSDIVEPMARLDFIKIDVEGFELAVLKGGVDLIKKFKPRMMIEVHTKAVPDRPVQVQEITDFLDSLDLGYVYEPVERQNGWYVHLYCHVPQFQLEAGLCDNQDEVESRHRWLHLTPDDLFVDVGAADGAWSIAALKQGAHVVAMDPAAKFTRLDDQVRKAGFGESDRIEVLEALATDSNGKTASVEFGRARVEVPGTTLDTFFMTTGQKPTFVKIDVEGDELAVLRGMQGILVSCKPKLMIEVHIETVKGKAVQIEEVEEIVKGACLDYRFERKMLAYEGKSYCHLYASVKGQG